MQDVERALADITAIRSQIARGTEFRGLGPATLAGTGLIAVLAAVLQAQWIAAPLAELEAWLGLWVGAAALAVAAIGVEMVTRSRRVHSGLALAMIQSAVEQFLPAAAAGLLLTLVIVRAAPEAVWMLPGLWQIVFSLGLFAAARTLPRGIVAAAVWYLGCGLGGIAMGQGGGALAPWLMGLPFGAGQLLVAAALHRAARRDAEGDAP